MLIHTEEKPSDKSIHTGEEPYIYDFIIESFIKKSRFTIYKNNPLSNLLVKIKLFCSQRTIGHKVIANSMQKSSLFILFCKTVADYHQRATFII